MKDNSKKRDSLANWKNLPTEIIHSTFQQVTCTQLSEPTHVCKAWTKTVQAILYADIKITSPSQFKKFCNTVKKHSDLGSYVKKLELYLQLDELREPEYSVTREEILVQLQELLALLPNLREYKEDSLRTFLPILTALRNSQLKQLRRLNPPHQAIIDSEIPLYVSCAMLMKNRLENIALSNYMDYSKSLTILYNDLASYEAVKEVEVEFREKTNEVEELEHIVETCKSLEIIKYSFYPKSTATPGASIDTISTYVPNTKIKTLTSSTTLIRDQTILPYIIHKFPKLQSLTLELGSNNPVEIDRNILARLFDYMKNIKYFSISRVVANQDALTTMIGNYWEAVSKPGYETVEIFQPDGDSGRLTLVHLKRTEDATNPTTTFIFPEENADSDYVDFIRKNGQFIGELQFGFTMMRFFRSTLCDVPENFISDTFTYCPNLRNLLMEQCALEKATFAQMDLSQSRSMDEIHLKNCSLYSGMLEQCSLMLPELKRLRLYGIKFFVDDDIHPGFLGYPSAVYPIEVVMPYTKIDTIIFEDIGSGESVYIKVFAMSNKKYNYYHIGPDQDLQCKASNKEEYNAENDSRHFYICCYENPELKFQII